MKEYFKSPTHRYGCIATIIGCLGIILGMIDLPVFVVVAVSYCLGIAIYKLKSTKTNSTHDISNYSEALPDQTTKPIPPPTTRTANTTSTITSNQQLPIHEKLLQDLHALEHKAKPFLNTKSRSLMIEIDEIMQFMNQKIQQSNNNIFKFEISDIQRTMSAYLSPALEYFCGLPSFLRDRKMTDSQQTPHQLIEQQLAMILEEMKKIAESIYQNDLNQLIDHGQYLKQKLQHSPFFNTHTDPES